MTAFFTAFSLSVCAAPCAAAWLQRGCKFYFGKPQADNSGSRSVRTGQALWQRGGNGRLTMADIKRTGGNGRRSTAVSYKGMVYTSGITSRLLEDGMRAQAQDVLQQIDALLAQHGTDKQRVLSASVTLYSMADYGEFNAAWDEWVIDGFEPTRSVTEGALAVPEYLVKVAVVAAV